MKIFYLLRLSLLFSGLFVSLQSKGSSFPSGLTSCGRVIASHAVDGATLATTNGETIILAGVKAPELWPKDAPYNSWPHAEAARAMLNSTTASQPLELFCEGERSDYTGNLIAHIKLPNEVWLQSLMVTAGNVYVFPRRNHLIGIDALYQDEQKARLEKKGVWALNPRTLTKADGNVNTGWFHIVRGRILSANSVRKTVFLNFGTDWRTDFTAEIPPQAVTAFKRSGRDPLALEGQEVEVRGWVTWKGGPHIMLEGPGQIRTLEIQAINR